jgi:hypothetical protein
MTNSIFANAFVEQPDEFTRLNMAMESIVSEINTDMQHLDHLYAFVDGIDNNHVAVEANVRDEMFQVVQIYGLESGDKNFFQKAIEAIKRVIEKIIAGFKKFFSFKKQKAEMVRKKFNSALEEYNDMKSNGVHFKDVTLSENLMESLILSHTFGDRQGHFVVNGPVVLEQSMKGMNIHSATTNLRHLVDEFIKTYTDVEEKYVSYDKLNMSDSVANAEAVAKDYESSAKVYNQLILDYFMQFANNIGYSSKKQETEDGFTVYDFHSKLHGQPKCIRSFALTVAPNVINIYPRYSDTGVIDPNEYNVHPFDISSQQIQTIVHAAMDLLKAEPNYVRLEDDFISAYEEVYKKVNAKLNLQHNELMPLEQRRAATRAYNGVRILQFPVNFFNYHLTYLSDACDQSERIISHFLKGQN